MRTDTYVRLCACKRKFASTMRTEHYEIPHRDENVTFELSARPSTNNQKFTECEKKSPSEEKKIAPRSNPKNRKNDKKHSSFPRKFTQQPIVWVNVIEMTLLHLISIYGFFTTIVHVKLLTLLWTFFVYLYSGFGLSAGIHRLWSHRSYKVKLPLKIILLFCYSSAGLNSVYRWVKDHRIHHKYTDTDADPHNTNRGFFFSHIGWLMQRKHPEVVEKAATIDVSDITNDPLLAFHTKYFIFFKILFCFVLPPIPAIWFWNESFINAVLWPMLIRYVLILNGVWSLNSLSHFFGRRPYNRWTSPTDNQFVSFVSLGEGCHNFHHTFPWDYSTPDLGHYWMFDLTTVLLHLFKKIGWAYDFKTASTELIRTTMMKKGDGSYISEVPIEYATSD